MKIFSIAVICGFTTVRVHVRNYCVANNLNAINALTLLDVVTVPVVVVVVAAPAVAFSTAGRGGGDWRCVTRATSTKGEGVTRLFYVPSLQGMLILLQLLQLLVDTRNLPLNYSTPITHCYCLSLKLCRISITIS